MDVMASIAPLFVAQRTGPDCRPRSGGGLVGGKVQVNGRIAAATGRKANHGPVVPEKRSTARSTPIVKPNWCVLFCASGAAWNERGIRRADVAAVRYEPGRSVGDSLRVKLQLAGCGPCPGPGRQNPRVRGRVVSFQELSWRSVGLAPDATTIGPGTENRVEPSAKSGRSSVAMASTKWGSPPNTSMTNSGVCWGCSPYLGCVRNGVKTGTSRVDQRNAVPLDELLVDLSVNCPYREVDARHAVMTSQKLFIRFGETISQALLRVHGLCSESHSPPGCWFSSKGLTL